MTIHDRWTNKSDPTVPLDAMARRASRMAEELFNESGELDPFWLVECPKGQALLLTPASSSEEKDAVASAIREFFAKHAVFRYAHACESWTIDIGKAGSAAETEWRLKNEWGGTLANCPYRQEMVYIYAQDAVAMLAAPRKILRPPSPAKPYLEGKLVLQPIKDLGGRHSNLLPSQGTLN
jgi:hypothetical protein